MRDEQQEQEYQAARERIAGILGVPMPDGKACDCHSCHIKYWHYADAILADPKIRIEAEDQTMPVCYEGNRPRAKAIRDMLEAGFVKVLPK